MTVEQDDHLFDLLTRLQAGDLTGLELHQALLEHRSMLAVAMESKCVLNNIIAGLRLLRGSNICYLNAGHTSDLLQDPSWIFVIQGITIEEDANDAYADLTEADVHVCQENAWVYLNQEGVQLAFIPTDIVASSRFTDVAKRVLIATLLHQLGNDISVLLGYNEISENVKKIDLNSYVRNQLNSIEVLIEHATEEQRQEFFLMRDKAVALL